MFRGAMAKRKLYHIGRTLRNRIAPAEGQARPLASRRMRRMKAAFPIFPSLRARDSQNRPVLQFRSGVVFLKKPGVSPEAHPCKQNRRRLPARDGRNGSDALKLGLYGTARFALANTGHAGGVDFPADQASGRERRSLSMPAPCIPVVMAMNADAVLSYFRALDSVEAHYSKPGVRSLKLLALCGPGRWQTHRAGGGRQASVGLEFEGRERCAEAGARRIRSAGDGSRRENSSAK